MWVKSLRATRPSVTAQAPEASRPYSASVSQAGVRSMRNSPLSWPLRNSSVSPVSMRAHPSFCSSPSNSWFSV